MNLKYFTKAVLRGIGQIFLQNNEITGLIFLIAIGCASLPLALAALAGSVIGTGGAFLFQYEIEDIEDGLYGYNAALSAVAITFFFNFSLITFAVLALSAISSTLIMRTMRKRNWYPYTLPFVISSWIFISATRVFHVAVFTPIDMFQAVTPVLPFALFRGFSQVVLINSAVSGIIIFFGILFNSFHKALYAFIGAVGGLCAAAILFPNMYAPIMLGLFCFNGILAGIAFADRKPYAFIFALIAIVLSVFIFRGFIFYTVLPLTAPFVFAVWISSRIHKLVTK